ncbi:unnamed protein product [Mytilus coruscus]|uniref:Uncharacterized protein n=1 Tax=Mytilus coruscus TaxID=42192 RepID=A0A6J8CWQ3_MYTCO|nr:unnamed protein product [Mytilus coruscus]
MKSNQTFYHNDGRSSSQIDYITSNNDILETTMVIQQSPINSSTHLPVKAITTKELDTKQQNRKKKNKTSYKLLWDKVDRKRYQSTFKELLASSQIKWTNYSVDEKLQDLTFILHKTAEPAVPKKLIKLNGFKRKASPTVLQLIRNSKNRHRKWDMAGRPRNGHKLFLAKKEAKCILRQQQRKEITIEQQFFDKLEHDPNDKTFFQVIKRNQSTVKSSAPEFIVKKEQIASTSNEQRQIFAEYFQELATPQNHPEFDDQLMQNSQRRCNIIKKVSKSERNRKIDVTKEEIKKAILKLKNGKTADEYH